MARGLGNGVASQGSRCSTCSILETLASEIVPKIIGYTLHCFNDDDDAIGLVDRGGGVIILVIEMGEIARYLACGS